MAPICLGTEYVFVTWQVKAIEAARWRQLQAKCEKIAAEHARECQYPNSNHWRRMKR